MNAPDQQPAKQGPHTGSAVLVPRQKQRGKRRAEGADQAIERQWWNLAQPILCPSRVEENPIGGNEEPPREDIGEDEIG